MSVYEGGAYAVGGSGGGGGAATWGSITGTLSNQTDLQSALDAKQAADGDLTAIAALVGTTGLLRKTAADTWTLDTNISGINTGDQTITLTGDVTGSGTGSFAATLANTAVAPGSYTRATLTVDSKGRLTAASTTASLDQFTEGQTTASPWSAANAAKSLTATALGSTRTDVQINGTGTFPAIVLGATSTQPGQASRVIGGSSVATSFGSVSIGNTSTASNQYAISIGRSSSATASDSISMGNGSVASATNAIAMGVQSVANGVSSTTVARGNAFTREGVLALGHSQGNHHQTNFFTHGAVISASGSTPLTADNSLTTNKIITMPNAFHFVKIVAHVLAVAQSGYNPSASWKIEECWLKDGSTYTRKSSIITNDFADAGAVNWTATIASDVANSGLKVMAYQDSATPTFWTASIMMTEVF